MLLMRVNVTSTVEHRHLVNNRNSSSNRLINTFRAHQLQSITVQHRSQFFTKTFSSQTVEVEVDGVVEVHQQEADGLHK